MSGRRRGLRRALVRELWVRAAALASLVAALSGCGLIGAEVRPVREVDFHVGVLPSSWRRVRGEGDAEFHHENTGAVILANEDCQEADSPLPVLADALLIGFSDRTVVAQRRVMLAGREALRSEVKARLDGVPVTIAAYVIKKDGCVYDLTYAAPPERYAEDRPAFEAFAAGFQTVGHPPR